MAVFSCRKQERVMTGQHVYIAAEFAVYLIAMLAVGVYFYRRTDNMADYFLGGRGLNKWVTSLSAEASDMSGWLMMGLPGAAYLGGLSAGWIALGLMAGTYVNWKFVARRLRQYTSVSMHIITLSDYMEHRFRDSSKTLRVVSSVFIFIFFLIYTASGFVASGRLFSSVFEMPYIAAVAIGAATIVFYTFLGGFNAVCWTDFFQGALMFFAMLTVPIVGVAASGGPTATVSALQAMDPNCFDPFHVKGGLSGLALLGAIASSMAWGLGYFGQPHILVRFMAIRSADEIRGARHIAMVWVIVSLIAAVVIGMIGHACMSAPLQGVGAERVYILMVNELCHPLVGGVLLAAILAAIMSTASSQLLVTASAVSEDFYKTFLRKNASDAELVWASRLTVFAVAIAAFSLALEPDSSVLELVAYAWAGFGAAFGPMFILSLYWRRMTRTGALAGIVTGGLTVLFWKQFHGSVFTLYEMLPGFFFSTLAIVLFSFAGKPPSDEITAEFDSLLEDSLPAANGGPGQATQKTCPLNIQDA
jgi:sodium/proline symporter